MRVLLSRKHDERGAVAVLVAILATVLLVFAAFVIDFGQAYVTKNRAQEAADAGALAAGRIYTDAKAYCDSGTVRTVTPLPVDLNTQVTTVRTANLANSTGVLTVGCETGTVRVTYTVDGDSPIGLGALATGTHHVAVHRHAVVQWGTSEKAVGSLRPWMLCSAQLPAQPFTSKVYEVSLPGNGHRPAPDTCGVNQPGDWWRLKCPGGGSSNNDSENAVLYGCPTVTIVPGTAGVTDPAQRTHILLHECNPNYLGSAWTYPPNKNKYVEKTDCLARDSGRDVKNLDSAWKTLLGQTIAVPVFCSGADCTPSSVVSDESKATWPVWKIAAVTVCGYGLHGAKSPSNLATVSNECNNANTDHLDPATTFDNDDLGFLLVFKGLIEKDGDAFHVDTKTTMRLVE